ncbi:MAG TPA: GTP cyclohydrolase I FolE [Rubrobacteraceae bacterium]|nr:GTP cyclohydrolase I FolE [Rubrobacteraceae bacterium]
MPGDEIDRPRIEGAVREILAAIGEDPDRQVLRETPERVAEAYAYLFGGLHEKPDRYLEVSFSGEFGDPVMLRDVPVASLCEHHLLPFIGKAHVGYVPDGRVVGLSEVVRVVEGYARRPQIQERLTAQIADSLHGALGSRGSIVVIEAEHTCMTMRGAEKPGTTTVTRAARGVYADDAALRAEFLAHVSDG